MKSSRTWTRRCWDVVALLAGALVAAGLLWHFTTGQEREAPGVEGLLNGPVQLASFQQAPALTLEGGTDWINSGPLTLAELRGKIVLLDFWTYCCINCHHILPDLAKLEQKYKNELVVIGVHSPKFFAEKDTENVRRKVREYHIKHPVVNDANQEIWQRFQVQGWPTLAVIDAKGKYRGAVSGEGHYDMLDRFIGQLVKEHREKGELNETPVRFSPEIEKPDTTGLLFPGKVVADGPGKRLFISDTGHHRIVVTDLQGKHPIVIGNGSEGLVDGDYKKAQFNRPQGMCLVGDTLYVADTENHALRAVDLKAKTVATVAGTGQQCQPHDVHHGPGKEIRLTSPWDVVQIPKTDTLMIAMAGQHQIWRFDIASGRVALWAGTGYENIVDGPPSRAAFAQPSGLATDGKHLFVADSEVSGVRSITLAKGHEYVGTIVGQGLFVFDDVDGTGDQVRLQHCLGLAYADGKLYIADTYNNKIKVCDPAAKTVKTLVGSRTPGDTDDPPRFYQPGGLSVAGRTLYVADTNNSLIRTVDLDSGRVKTLEVEDLAPPSRRRELPKFLNAQVIDARPVNVAPGRTVTLEVSLPLPAGSKLNKDVDMPYVIEAPGQTNVLADGSEPKLERISQPTPSFEVIARLAKPAKAGDQVKLKLSVSAFACSEGSNLCFVKNYVYNVPVTFTSGQPDRAAIKPKPTEKSGSDRP